MSEAWEAASGVVVFLFGVIAMGAVVVLVGWTAARYTPMALAIGFGATASILGVMTWTAMRWARQEPAISRHANGTPRQRDRALRHAA